MFELISTSKQSTLNFPDDLAPPEGVTYASYQGLYWELDTGVWVEIALGAIPSGATVYVLDSGETFVAEDNIEEMIEIRAEALTAPNVTQDVATSLMGQWQARVFDPTKIIRVGMWKAFASDGYATALNSTVHTINPTLARMQRSEKVPYAGSIDGYPLWNPNNPARPEYFQSSQWWPGYENFRLHTEDWEEWAMLNLPLIIDWIAPNWLNLAGVPDALPTIATPMPFLMFFSPNGKLDEGRGGNRMDFYSALRSLEWGLKHLVEGFPQLLRRLHAYGITTCWYDGCPGENQASIKRSAKDLNDVMEMRKYSRAVQGLDALIVRPTGDVDEEVCDEFLGTGDGVLLETIPQADAPAQMAWLAKGPHISTHYRFFKERCVVQEAWAVGHWPMYNHASFDTTYAGKTIFLQVGDADFAAVPAGVFGGAVDAAELVYLQTTAAAVIALAADLPQAVWLFSPFFIALCAKHDYAMTNFLPP